MRRDIVRTVLGDIEPAGLGFTLAHEHLAAHPPAFVADPDLQLEDEAAAARELAGFREAGGASVVEMTTLDYGRDGPALVRLSRAAGMHIVAATGFNKARFADRIASRHSTEAIAAWMVREIEEGLVAAGADSIGAPPEPAPFAARAGLIKASSSLDGPTPDERRVFAAAVMAQRASGAPVATHTEKGTWAMQQARLLLDAGVPAGKILLSHLDFRPDVGFLLELLATGVRIGFDQFGKAKYLPDEERLDLVETLAAHGRLGSLLLSGDMARRSSWSSTGGGPGLAHIPTTIRQALRDRGFSDSDLRRLFETNAAEWLAFRPRTTFTRDDRDAASDRRVATVGPSDGRGA